MSARAIWQGSLHFQKETLDVRLFTAVEDRAIHFHLLHRSDGVRLQQRMIDPKTGEPVASSEARKAYKAENGTYVRIDQAEIEQASPPPGRAITITRFLPAKAINPFWFERPYYLAPDPESVETYFALAQALQSKQGAGIAQWVMRKHSYVGAVLVQKEHLMLISLRHAGEVVSLAELAPDAERKLDAKELDLALKLVEALSGEFDPSVYHDEYQDRLREFIDAKRNGKKIKTKRAPAPRTEGSLADSLRASLEGLGKQQKRQVAR